MTEKSKGAAVYSHTALRFYDRVVLGPCFSYAWRCPTKTQLIPFFKTNTTPTSSDSTHSRRLLDIGVGTGFFLEHAHLTSVSSLTLVDLNPNCLEVASARARRAHPRIDCSTVLADFLTPDGLASRVGEGPFDAISVMLLLHCLPGPPSRKAAALVRLKNLLTKESGVLFGATILGKGVTHNLFGRLLMWWLNSKGIFDNREDEVTSFVAPLEEAFDEVKWRIVGKVLLFEAKGPRV
ncbi:S-adenosyl-L-methionine-dependent methyltransferase [Mycena latifolia]|nr:S-adenosyl-L-methionine-dependent methyltransferase [Mycena latifolia]KAJ7470746.1 S-adenosyl-L-methionine-dependent methyltransferase [Mycena latifolia]